MGIPGTSAERAPARWTGIGEHGTLPALPEDIRADETANEENVAMKTGKLLPTLLIALSIPAARAAAETDGAPAPRERIVLRELGARVPASSIQSGDVGDPRIRALAATAPAAAYSVELSQVARLAGLGAFYRTAIDITNNTGNGGVNARVQYSYGNAACAGNLCRTQPLVIPLAAVDNFHTDDMVSYLNDRGLLVAGAVDNAVGTLLVTFENLPTANGWEGTAVARIYTRVDEANPALGTIGYAFPASLFFDSAHQSVGAVARTTGAASPTNIQGSQRTNLGVRNTDNAGTDDPVNADIRLYDVTEGSPTNGQQVGNTLAVNNLLPGEVRLVGNVMGTAQVPASITQVLAFIDVRNPTAFTPTIEGFLVTIDNDTQDGSYFPMPCQDSPYTCGQN
jgi:hypothetical protein